jgi:putative transposase
MNTAAPANHHKNQRLLVETISHAVGFSFRFCGSYRDVAELLFDRGVVVTYKAIQKCYRKFG